MPIYDFICTECAAQSESTRPDVHEYVGCGGCGGALRRNWKSISINTANLRSARD
jgi:putative FmdB family regulatory protein